MAWMAAPGAASRPTLNVAPGTPGPSFDPARAVDTDGLPTGDVEIRITDPATLRELPVGGSGEIWLRGPELFVGYVDPVQTAAAHVRGWFRSGDLGRRQARAGVRGEPRAERGGGRQPSRPRDARPAPATGRGDTLAVHAAGARAAGGARPRALDAARTGAPDAPTGVAARSDCL